MSISEVEESSEEVRLDREIKSRIARVVSGRASEQDKSELQHLLEQRSNMMRSPIFDQMRDLRERVRRSA